MKEFDPQPSEFSDDACTNKILTCSSSIGQKPMFSYHNICHSPILWVIIPTSSSVHCDTLCNFFCLLLSDQIQFNPGGALWFPGPESPLYSGRHASEEVPFYPWLWDLFDHSLCSIPCGSIVD
jgi:hypothetical protein